MQHLGIFSKKNKNTDDAGISWESINTHSDVKNDPAERHKVYFIFFIFYFFFPPSRRHRFILVSGWKSFSKNWNRDGTRRKCSAHSFFTCVCFVTSNKVIFSHFPHSDIYWPSGHQNTGFVVGWDGKLRENFSPFHSFITPLLRGHD